MKQAVIVGLGVQGKKRIKHLKSKTYFTVDPYKKSDYKKLQEVPTKLYDKVFLCVPDSKKLELIKYCINKGKHCLIEKPFPNIDNKKILKLENLANKKKVVCYVAYNHRFEPHFVRLKKILEKKEIGKVYLCRLLYGNGTSKLVKKSEWRDKGNGVVDDIGSHLFDICKFWFNINSSKIQFFNSYKFENNSPDHAQIIFNDKKINFIFEMSLCMWRNTFNCDIIGEKGSIHINSLTKWDKTTLILRKRVFPSGKPKEKKYSIKIKDPTWKKEYNYFLSLIKNGKTNFINDFFINSSLKKLKIKS